MDRFQSVDELLDFAIKREEEANRFYTEMAEKMEKPWMKETFLDFASEELKHKEKLLGVKEGKYLEPSKEKILDLKIAEYLTAKAPRADMDYQEALILAMKREKKAYQLYNSLAGATDDEDVKKTLEALAQEEAKHKLWLETEYDKVILTDN